MHAVAHSHTTAGQAVACQANGLLPLRFTSLFYTDRVAYHDFEGITLDVDECDRLARDLGDRRQMILRNHGLFSCGPTIADAFLDLYNLQRACEVQIAAQAGGGPLQTPSAAAIENCAAQHARVQAKGQEAQMLYQAMMRWMTDKDPSFLD